MSLLRALGLFYSSFLFLVAVFFLTEKQAISGALNFESKSLEGKNQQVMGQEAGEVELSIEQLVSRLIWFAPQGVELSKKERSLMQKGKVGGVFLVGRNIGNQEQVEQLVRQVQELGAFVAIDQEGGSVSRLPWVEKTPQREIATEVEAFNIAQTRGGQLRQLGIRMNLAPVVEVARDLCQGRTLGNCQGPTFIENRAFVTDNGRLAAAMVKGYLEAGIIPVAKHFPGGLGRVAENPHRTLPIINFAQVGPVYETGPRPGLRSDFLKRLEEDLEPFRAVVAAQVPAIMVTHILYPELDKMPASASQIFMDDILKGRLGFTGLVVVDDLSMAAVKDNYEVGEYAVQSLKAGADLVLVSDFADYERIVTAVTDAVEQGELNREWLLEAHAKLEELF